MSIGFWRRMNLIPFTVTIPQEKRRNFSEILKEFEIEFPGILNWVINGFFLWRETELRPSEAVRQATEEYRSGEDIFQQFLDEETDLGENFSIAKDELLEAFNTYLTKSGERALFSKRRLGDELAKRGIKAGGAANKYYIGIKLFSPFSNFTGEIPH